MAIKKQILANLALVICRWFRCS